MLGKGYFGSYSTFGDKTTQLNEFFEKHKMGECPDDIDCSDNARNHFVILEEGEELEDIQDVEKAKQDVAREIFEEIEKFIESDRGKVICESYGSELEKDLCKTFEIYHNMGTDDTKNALSDFLDELKKKYIGE